MLLAVLATVGVVAGALLTGAPAGHVVRRDGGPEAAAVVRPAARVLDVLRSWDRRRARAWAAGDALALRALYLPGSRTGRRDVAMLAAYRGVGCGSPRCDDRCSPLRVRSRDAGTLSLVVTDRLAEARVTGGTRAVLPRSRPATRRIVLRRTSSGWCVAEVYGD